MVEDFKRGGIFLLHFAFVSLLFLVWPCVFCSHFQALTSVPSLLGEGEYLQSKLLARAQTEEAEGNPLVLQYLGRARSIVVLQYLGRSKEYREMIDEILLVERHTFSAP